MMKINLMIGAVAAAMLLAACATAGDEPASSGEVAPRVKSLADARAEPSANQLLPEAKAARLMWLLATLYEGYPGSNEGKPTIEITVAKNEDGAYVATIIQTGILDDSVAQIKDVLTLGQRDEWYVVTKQSWRKCYRTSMFEWTTKLCP